MFGISCRIAAADEFYDGNINEAVYGDIIISADNTFFFADFNGAPMLDGGESVDYILLSLVKAAEYLEKGTACSFAGTYENSGYLCFERNGDELTVKELEYCTPAGDFSEGLPDSGEEVCSAKVSFKQFAEEVGTKAKMFLSELSSLDMRLMNTPAVKELKEKIG